MNKKIYIAALIIISIFLVFQAFVIGAEEESTITFNGIGSLDVLSFGDENTNHTVTSDTYWAWDEISVVAEEEANSVLDQLVFSDITCTHISRNALFIGPGNIETMSQYNGSNAGDGENSVTGIIVEGENYGALIQNGSLFFNEDFGGIEESLAVGGGNYSVEQFGGFGNINGSDSYVPGVDDPWTFVTLGGDRSGTIGSAEFGSAPQPGPDVFSAKTKAWATEEWAYSFGAYSSSIDVYLYLESTHAKLYTLADFERLKAESSLSGNDY